MYTPFQDELSILNRCDQHLNSGDVVQLIKCEGLSVHEEAKGQKHSSQITTEQ